MTRVALLAAASLMALHTVPAAASYMPVGPQANVLKTSVTDGGWTLCWQGNFTTQATIASMLAGCQGGTNLMMAASPTEAATTFTVLAQAAFADVTYESGTGNVTHNANGVEWYFNDSWSWGFANAGASVSRNSCDTNGSGADGALRMCWHTDNGALHPVGGYRAGNDYTNFDSSYQRYLYVNTAADVPEPAMLALFGLGALGLAGARRRRA